MASHAVISTTKSEIRFIKTIGTHSSANTRCSKEQLLRGYLEGLEKRVKFDNLDQQKIKQVALAELSKVSKPTRSVIKFSLSNDQIREKEWQNNQN